MQRLRTTFTRSRTPTGADMKTQSSLEVPKQIRSASFDGSQLDSPGTSTTNASSTSTSSSAAHHLPMRHQHSVATDDGRTGSSGDLLTVPLPHHHHPNHPHQSQQRSRSFDSAGGNAADDHRLLDVPRRFQQECRRRLSAQNQSAAAAAAAAASAEDATASAAAAVSGTTAPPPLPPPLPQSPALAAATATAPACIHCVYLAEYERQTSAEQRYFIDHNEVELLLSLRSRQEATADSASTSTGSRSSASSPPSVSGSASGGDSSADENDNDSGAEDGVGHDAPPFGQYLAPPTLHSPGITFTLSPTGEAPPIPLDIAAPICAGGLRLGAPRAVDSSPSTASDEFRRSDAATEDTAADDDDDRPSIAPSPTQQRRRSISRQEAVFAEPTESSLENVAAAAAAVDCSVQDIYLAVPDLKRDRAASVDSCFVRVASGGKTEVLRPPDGEFMLLAVPAPGGGGGAGTRSRSVDIVLPTQEQARYKALALTSAPGAMGYHRLQRNSVSETTQRQPRQTPDWGEHAVAGDHLWSSTSISGDFCYVGDSECTKHGPRMKCSACKIVVHTSCLPIVMQRAQMACKPTFRDVGVRQYREQTTTHHHWVHRRTEKGKCQQCSKALQAKLSFSSKEIVALSCAWCKHAYHNKESCFNPDRIGEECALGTHAHIIVPPSWIVKLPRGGGFKSSLRKQPRSKKDGGKGGKSKESAAAKPEVAAAVAEKPRTFVIKSIPTASVTPVLVFINPKSGGNQGVKLMQKFQWLLNPRQVFDLTQGGPNFGLELFSKTPQLRVLACGGDGTVGWVLSVLDKIGINPAPPVGVLPLGTGNDLARALGWGGGYTDEPITKILSNIADSDTILLDRWSLDVTPNPDAQDDGGKDTLPLNVVNNYFSFGVDAHIALEFHEAREAHPEKFNSRLRNKMFYGTAGGKDLLRRKWKGLAELVTLECDGKDMTAKLKEHRVHAIVFLNIQSYGGGTHPWNNSGGQFQRPATDDGMIEVVGLTTYQLPLLQAGGHGTCIAQCKTARIVTSKTIPMQVDGEAAKLKPSIIEIGLLNKAVMLAKKKQGRSNVHLAGLEPLSIALRRITMADYERYHYDTELLVKTAVDVGAVEVNPISDLENVRGQINKYVLEKGGAATDATRLSADWCFVDCCTAERFFRIDRAQEHLHYVTDIAQDTIYLLDPEAASATTTNTTSSVLPPHTPDTDTEAPPHHPHLYHATSSGSSDNLDSRDSRAGTPSSPNGRGNRAFFQRSVSGGAASSVASLSPLPGDVAGRKCSHTSDSSQGSQSSDVANSEYLRNGARNMEPAVNFKRNLLEKTSDAVIKAAKTGDLVMLKELHTQGYSLLSIDATGQTALHYGSKHGHRDIVKYLISYAPNSVVNMVDNARGQTALHKAASAKHRGICYMLVAAGGNLSLRDADGQTPMMHAFQANDHDLAAYLESQEKFLHMDYGGST